VHAPSCPLRWALSHHALHHGSGPYSFITELANYVRLKENSEMGWNSGKRDGSRKAGCACLRFFLVEELVEHGFQYLGLVLQW